VARRAPSSARLFVALELPEAARAALVAWRDGVLGGVPAAELRLVPPEALHVTLAFLGHLPVASVDEVASVAFGALGGLGPAVLAATGMRALPPRRPRLYALDLADPRGAAGRVQEAVAGRLATAGLYEPERRRFWPHVTLARVRTGGAPQVDAKGAAAPPAEAFEAREVVLYRSHLGRGGSRYEALARHALRA
jgi:2'-5' RNA ligase